MSSFHHHEHSQDAPHMSTLDLFVHTLESTDGRDKITKVVQYLGKILLQFYKSQNKQKNALAIGLSRVVSALSDGRRCFRIGRFVGDLEELLSGGPLEKVQGAIGLVSDVSENFCWLYGIWKDGEVPEWVERFEQLGDVCWFFEVCMSIYYAWVELRYLDQQIATLKGSIRKKKVSIDLGDTPSRTSPVDLRSNVQTDSTSNAAETSFGSPGSLPNSSKQLSNETRVKLRKALLKRRLLLLQIVKLVGDFIQSGLYGFAIEWPWTNTSAGLLAALFGTIRAWIKTREESIS